MRLIQFETAGQPQVGILKDQTIHALEQVADMHDVIAICSAADGYEQLEQGSTNSKTYALEEVTLLAPIHPHRNILCVGWNYLKHFNEGIGKREQYEVEDLPERPTFFSKLPTTVAAPYQALPLHEGLTEKLDWEVELAVIIGKEGTNIPEQEALAHVFGYTVANDLSARDLQRAHGGQWFKGKSLDLTCPLGPWIVTADEIGNPQNLNLECRLNDQLMQQANTAQQIFPVAKIISELSAGITLRPGDVILTGTPEGVGAAQNPPLFLKAGDVLECTVAEIGSIKNSFHESSDLK